MYMSVNPGVLSALVLLYAAAAGGVGEEEFPCTVERVPWTVPLITPRVTPAIFVAPPGWNAQFGEITAREAMLARSAELSPVLLTSSNSYSEGKLEMSLEDYIWQHVDGALQTQVHGQQYCMAGAVKGAEAGHDVGDRGQVGEDLRTGALLVRERVGGVAVLVEHHPVGVLRGHLLGDPHGLVGAARGG